MPIWNNKSFHICLTKPGLANIFSHKYKKENFIPVFFLGRMESYLNPVCGVKTEVAEPHGEPPSRGMDHPVHTLLVIKIIQQTKNTYNFKFFYSSNKLSRRCLSTRYNWKIGVLCLYIHLYLYRGCTCTEAVPVPYWFCTCTCTYPEAVPVIRRYL